MKIQLRKEAGDGWTFDAVLAFAEMLRRLISHALSSEKAAKLTIEIVGGDS